VDLSGLEVVRSDLPERLFDSILVNRIGFVEAASIAGAVKTRQCSRASPVQQASPERQRPASAAKTRRSGKDPPVRQDKIAAAKLSFPSGWAMK